MEYCITLGYAYLEEVKGLFTEYTESLGVDLSFQSYAEEYGNLPGQYSPPAGRLYILFCEEMAVGCVALQPLVQGICEMKRLYVKPAYRRYHFGERLVEQILADAKEMGYQKVYLDTLPFMESAIALYRKFGFQEISPYYENPIEGTLYLAVAV